MKEQTAVEWLREKLQLEFGFIFSDNILNQAKEMEKKEKIEFACQVAEASAEKYIQGKTTWQIAEELLTFKSE
jgi:hypothetical protein